VPVRAAGPDDVETVARLIGELAVYEGLEHEAVATVADLRAVMTGPDPVVTVSLATEADGTVVGCALWYRTYSTFTGRTGIWLEDLFVRPASRGSGHGRALLEHLRSLTDGRVEWDVLDWNTPAIGFYENLGARAHTGWTKYRWT
jgi:GNAT superfamily N-acetyltransferase